MSLTPALVTIQREIRTGDGAGGHILTWTIVGTAMATQNYYGHRFQLVHDEAGARGTAGPGLENDKLQLFVFETKPFPVIKNQDRIVNAAGTAYTVKWVRDTYEDSLQVDTEVIEE